MFRYFSTDPKVPEEFLPPITNTYSPTVAETEPTLGVFKEGNTLFFPVFKLMLSTLYNILYTFLNKKYKTFLISNK